MNDSLKQILEQLKNGNISVEEAYETLRTYDCIGYATLDIHREKGRAFPKSFLVKEKLKNIYLVFSKD